MTVVRPPAAATTGSSLRLGRGRRSKKRATPPAVLTIHTLAGTTSVELGPKSGSRESVPPVTFGDAEGTPAGAIAAPLVDGAGGSLGTDGAKLGAAESGAAEGDPTDEALNDAGGGGTIGPGVGLGVGTGVGLGVGTGVGLGVGTGVGNGVGTGVGVGAVTTTFAGVTDVRVKVFGPVDEERVALNV